MNWPAGASPFRYNRPMSRSSLIWRGVPPALLSAALFGASTPFAKLLLGSGLSPWLLAGLLYLGSGIGLAALLALRQIGPRRSAEPPLRMSDMPCLALVVLTGGIPGPVLLMIGLASTP